MAANKPPNVHAHFSRVPSARARLILIFHTIPLHFFLSLIKQTCAHVHTIDDDNGQKEGKK
jgi:hypothetical protein